MILKPKWLTKLELGHWAAKGLVGSWIFNEGGGDLAYDSSGNGNHGTFNGNPQWVGGQDGPVLDFGGAGDYITCGNKSSLNSGFITVLWWMKIRTSQTQTIISHRSTVSSGHFNLIMLGSTLRIDAYVPAANNWNTPPTFVVDRWYHVGWTYDGVLNCLYVDGVFEGDNGGNSGPLDSSMADLHFGVLSNNQTLPFDGQIGSVKIYNRALNASEIFKLNYKPYQMYKRGG